MRSTKKMRFSPSEIFVLSTALLVIATCFVIFVEYLSSELVTIQGTVISSDIILQKKGSFQNICEVSFSTEILNVNFNLPKEKCSQYSINQIRCIEVHRGKFLNILFPSQIFEKNSC